MNEKHNSGRKKAEQKVCLIRQEVVVRATGSGPPERVRKPKGAGGTYLLTSCGTEAASGFDMNNVFPFGSQIVKKRMKCMKNV